MNEGTFILGVVLLVLGIFSDIYNYYDQFAAAFMVVGLVLLIIGALMPSIVTSTERKEISIPERRTKTVVREE